MAKQPVVKNAEGKAGGAADSEVRSDGFGRRGGKKAAKGAKNARGRDVQGGLDSGEPVDSGVGDVDAYLDLRVTIEQMTAALAQAKDEAVQAKNEAAAAAVERDDRIAALEAALARRSVALEASAIAPVGEAAPESVPEAGVQDVDAYLDLRATIEQLTAALAQANDEAVQAGEALSDRDRQVVALGRFIRP